MLRFVPIIRTLFLTLACQAVLTTADDLATCQPHDFHYEYTECDSQGGRWRVSVPAPGKCMGGAPNPPTRGKGCDFTCDAGQYLDIEGDQECQPCPAGTYSLGGGVRFSDWEHMPSGFASEVDTFSGPGYMAAFGFGGLSGGSSYDHEEEGNCTGTGWTPANKYVSAQAEVDCYARLTYTANLVTTGSVRFSYQSTDKDTLLHFQVKNSECEAFRSHHNGKYASTTEEGEWRSIMMPLNTGINLLMWTIFAQESSEGSGIRKPVLIKNIEILGIAYTSECMKCPAGTVSDEKAEDCKECTPGSYSNKGEPTCTQCDAVTEYSDSGASSCIKRKPCEVTDYYSYNTLCDQNNMTKTMFNWIAPRVCRDDVTGAASLPAPQDPRPCPPCNPGMETFNGTCRFCPDNQFSDGTGQCKACPGSTAPETKIQYKWWNNLPENANLSAYCLSLTDRGCASKSGWQNSLDYMHSGQGHADDVYLVMSLKVGGFRGKEQLVNGRSVPVGEIAFEFETECSDPECSFILMQQNVRTGTNAIKTWSGPQPRQAYSYDVISTDPVTFIWAYQKRDPAEYDYMKVGEEGTFSLINDRALIYAINVTHTLDGGATSCKTCPKGSSQEGCIPCGPGEYVDSGTGQCTMCPNNQIVRGVGGQDGCVPCGAGLHTTDHVRCETQCKLVSGGKEYDFTGLSGVRTIKGSTLFTSEGTQYYHIFNISLCGGSQNHPIVQCADNITFPGEDGELTKDITIVESNICRSTIIPPIPGDNTIMSAQPVSLGDTLVNITNNGSTLNMAKRMKDEGFTFKDDDLDVHFVYISDRLTDACLKGRSTVITLRCDPSQFDNGTISLPPKCSDGTCDGCNFHLLWYSKQACPVCKREDYKELREECIGGFQNITYIPPKHCILLEDSKLIGEKQKCSVRWPSWLTVVVYVVPILVVLVVIFIIVAIYCCLRNRNLEYKYMKLVASSGGKDGNYDELPAAETCALEDGDEDEEPFDSVQFKETRGKKLFDKFKSGKKKGFLGNLKSMPLTMGFQKPKKYGVVDPDLEELFSEEEEINMDA